MRRHLFRLSLVSMACISTAFAATPVNLNHQPITTLQSLVTTQLSAPETGVKQLSSTVDFNNTSHIRFQQTYSGYPVWGSDAVAHVPHHHTATLNQLTADTTMNGTIYQNLKADLQNTPQIIFTKAYADKAMQHATQLFQQKSGSKQIDLSKSKNNLMVYVDKNNKAHWAFFIAFFAHEKQGVPAVPTYIIDANTFTVYEQWNDLQTLEDVKGGGFGGNPKMGKVVYDSLQDDYPALDMQRDSSTQMCSLQNANVTVLDDNKATSSFSDAPVAQFKCESRDHNHSNLYWDADEDSVNEGYSPANDALYIGQVIKDMYQKWYNVPVLSFFGFPMMLKMNVHARDTSGEVMDNAFFLSLNSEMYFGDGLSMFYPLTSLGVGAHEISHGFTSQHSNLTYQHQSGGLNEAYSDMAAQAAEYYSTGQNSWQIGPEIVKGQGALRYMDDPTKDGKSIGHVKDYNDSMNVHHTSGVFNKVFYLLGTAEDWNTRKAFDVMVQANVNYWTANSTFADAACGVVKATHDYNYDMTAVKHAMNTVGIDISHC